MRRATVEEASVESMQAYYARRAATYERVYHKPERQQDLRAMEAWVGAAFHGHRVLELAAGTGWWTPHGASHAASWLATDLNSETLAIAQAKAMPPSVSFEQADAYAPERFAGRGFDAVFAGFWWSHIPLARLPHWLRQLHACLAPGGRVVFVDNSFVPSSSTPLSRHDGDGNTYQLRALDDGSTHEVLKNFPTREQANQAIGERAVDVQWLALTHYWALSYTLARST